MFGIKYAKFSQMNYVIHYKKGEKVKSGKGLSFFFNSTNSTLVSIPCNSFDYLFLFEETSSDYQDIYIQGEVTYRIHDPEKISEVLDFTINTRNQYISEDYEKIERRVANSIQTIVSPYVKSFGVKDILGKNAELEQFIISELPKAVNLLSLGIEVLGVNILSIKANEEMMRALESHTRESLQQESDEAIYARRKFAVDQEKIIKESELNTEIAIEEKQKEIVTKKMETVKIQKEQDRQVKMMEAETKAEIANKESEYVKQYAENQKTLSDAKAYELKSMLDQYKGLDWKLVAALKNESDPANNISMAFRELAENSSKIENLYISPELLTSLLNKGTDHGN